MIPAAGTHAGMRILVFGAGVVGRVYAGRLRASGQDVSILVRGLDLVTLRRDGIVLENRGQRSSYAVPVLDTAAGTGHWDLVVVAVRRDQLRAALPALAELSAGTVLFLGSVAEEEEVTRQLGQRVVFGFPGIGGLRTRDGAIRFVEIAQQPTTLGRNAGLEEPLRAALSSAGFAVAVTDDMGAWMRTHEVFVVAVGAAILASDGDSIRLTADPELMAKLVRSVREGFTALAAHGIAVTPRGLRTIFTVVPERLAVWYWRRVLRGDVGTVAMTPHVRRSADTELALLTRDVRKILAGGPPTPTLDSLLALAARSPHVDG